jgi:16S rRNA (guanine527-N7)-methyltransferase
MRLKEKQNKHDLHEKHVYRSWAGRSLPSRPASDYSWGVRSYQEIASESGLSLGAGHEEALERYLALLERWGARINLTAEPSREVVRTRQLPDAFQLAALLGPVRGRAIDAGAGAGLVSIPLALLCPDLSLTLVESNQKKCAFLREAIRELDLALEVRAARVEYLEDRFPLALSRATWPPERWAEVATGLVEEGGRIVFFTTESPSLPGLEPVATRAYRVEGAPRCISIWRRSVSRETVDSSSRSGARGRPGST